MTRTMTTMNPKRLMALFSCLAAFTTVMCADEAKQASTPPAPPAAPLRLEPKDVIRPKGAAAWLHTTVELQTTQGNERAGITATVIVTNRGVEPVNVIDPVTLTEIELTASDGRRLDAGRADVSHPRMLVLEPAQEHRFTVTVRETYERPVPVASATPPAREPRELPEIDTMSTASDAGAPGMASPPEPARRVALPPGRYAVRVRIGLGAAPVSDPAARSARSMITDPISVAFGEN